MHPKHHSYSLIVIGLALDIAGLGLSNRKVVEVLKVTQRFVTYGFTVPSYGSVRNWVAKRGCYILDPRSRKDALENDWCIIADVSISIGAQRLLVVLGVDLSKYDHSLPLCLEDIEVLGLTALTFDGWTAQRLTDYLAKHILAHYSVAYMVTDGGPNLIRAAKDLGLERIDDISHAVAKSVKSAYTQVDGFKDFMDACIHLRRYNGLNNFIGLRPPMLRGKARFMNVSCLIYWAKDMLDLMDGDVTTRYGKRPLSDQDRGKLNWLIKYKSMITNMSRELNLIETISRGLKAEGISKQSVRWAKKKLQHQAVQRFMQSKVRLDVCHYLDDQLAKCERLKRDSVICSTDIIESCFGIYKEERPKGQVVNYHTLRMASYGAGDLTAQRTLESMEAKTLNEVGHEIKDLIKRKPTKRKEEKGVESDKPTSLSP